MSLKIPFEGHEPNLGRNVFIAQGASVIGQVTMGDDSSVWYGCVIRGDVNTIHIGARTNIQDLSVIHVNAETHPTVIGSDVTVGHRAILHGCTIEDHVLIGMGAIILDGAHIGAYSFIGAGSLVTPNRRIPPGSMVLGSPAQVARELSEIERQRIDLSAAHYVDLASRYSM